MKAIIWSEGGDSMVLQKCDFDCSFCNEIIGNSENNMFFQYFQKYINNSGLEHRFILETNRFCVMPSIGPLVEGHLLILPKEHYLSYAHVPNCQHQELANLQGAIRQLLQNVYCAPIFFEHGPMSKKLKGGCCYDHAHLHAIPLAVDIKDELLQFGFAYRTIQTFEELKQQEERNMPYLFFEDQHEEKIVCDAPFVESQFIRKLLALKANKQDVMFWQYNLQVDLVVATLQRLKKYSFQNKNVLKEACSE